MDVFSIVAEPTRRAIVDLLGSRDRTAGELVDSFPDLTQPAVSRHLRLLRESKLVRVRIAAQKRIYSLQPERLSEIDAWIGRYRHFWSGRLDALEGHLARTHRRRRLRSKRKS